MVKPRHIIRMIFLFICLAIFGSTNVLARTCNDSKYDGDNDGVNEIRLKSSCQMYVKAFIQRITHKITNLTKDEWYIVDYKSAGYYRSPVKPGWWYSRTSDTYKSCPARNKGGAEFTRTRPKSNQKVTVSSAKACVPGWVLLHDIKFLKDLFASAATDTLKLDTTLAAAEGDSEDGNTLLAIHSEVHWDKDQALYIYTYTVTNEHDEAMDFAIFAIPSPDYPDGWEGHVDAHATVERSFTVSSTEEENDPVENVGYISFTVGEEPTESGFMLSAVSPGYLVPEETRDFREEDEGVTTAADEDWEMSEDEDTEIHSDDSGDEDSDLWPE